MSQDRLYFYVKHHLESCDPLFQGQEDVLYHSVGDYMAELMAQGNIPQSSLDSLEEVLMEEALDIYRKLTYGFLNFAEYSKHKRQLKFSC